MVVNEFGTLTVDNLLPEVFVLQKVQEIKAHRVFQVLCIFRLLPVLKILEVVDKGLVLGDESILGRMQ